MARILLMQTGRLVGEFPSVTIDFRPRLWTMPKGHELANRLYLLAYDESEANVMVERIMADIDLEKVC